MNVQQESCWVRVPYVTLLVSDMASEDAGPWLTVCSLQYESNPANPCRVLEPVPADSGRSRQVAGRCLFIFIFLNFLFFFIQ